MTPALLDEIGTERVDALVQEAAQEAIAEAHAHGLPVAIGKPDGSIVSLFPDGHEELISPAPAATKSEAINA